MSTYLSTKESFDYAKIIEKDQFTTIIQWTKEKGQINKDYSYEDLTDFRFIK
jgi:NitT/TauT family transport system substrate-binding protein